MLDGQVELRRRLGEAIAAVSHIWIRKKGGAWRVPSESGNGPYTVYHDPINPRCTCPDFETTGEKCKHLYAVDYVIQRRENPAAAKTAETLAAKRTRKTYPQDWAAYNAAQTSEKDYFQSLLFDLCEFVPDVPHHRGRRPIPLSDAVFDMAFKMFLTFSGRRFIPDLKAAYEKSFISTIPHFNTGLLYMRKPLITPVLIDLIQISSAPLISLEHNFAADSTSFMGCRYVRWFDKRHRGEDLTDTHDWVKAHLMCGVKTNVVTAVEIYDRYAGDAPQLPALLETTSTLFDIDEVYADKAYSTVKNLETLERYTAHAYIPFKSNTTGGRGGIWARAYHYFQLHGEEFLKHYHQRSNVEATMAMIKAKFRDEVRSKSDAGMVNEVLCKILCHNICCLIQSVHEFGIDPSFMPHRDAA